MYSTQLNYLCWGLFVFPTKSRKVSVMHREQLWIQSPPPSCLSAWVHFILFLHISGMHSGRKKTILAPLQQRRKDLLNCVKVLFSGCCPRTDEISSDLISTMPIGLRKISVWETAKHSKHFTSNTVCVCVCAAEDDKDHFVEESEVTPCETRAEEPFLLQKPVTRARLEARTESLQRTDSLQVRRSV